MAVNPNVVTDHGIVGTVSDQQLFFGVLFCESGNDISKRICTKYF